MTIRRVYAKKITLAAAGLVASIGAYVKDDGSDHVGSLCVALFEDNNAGTPRYLLGYNAPPTASILPETAASTTAYRWLQVPLGVYAAAGDYWLAVRDSSPSPLVIAYDGSGTDRYYTSGGAWFADWGWYTPTTGSLKYSIRASVIS